MRRAFLAALLLASPAALDAQAGSPARSGVLLALQECHGGEWCGLQTTYWIVREGDRVRIAARGAGLLVPRRDGFWWMGAFGGTNRFGSQADEAEVPCDTAKAADTAEVMADDAVDPMDDSTPGVIWARRAGVRDTTQYELTTWGNDATWLDWVTGDWIAYSDRSLDNREHIHRSHGVLKFEALLAPSPDSVAGFVPDSAPWERAERACLSRVFGVNADSVMADPDAIDPFGTRYWTVRRERTRWRIASIYYPNSWYDEGGNTCEVPTGSTAPMRGHDRVTIPWSAIKNVLPDAITAFESPSGDLLLVQAGGSWHAFIPRDGRLGSVVARLDLVGVPIMAQWAVGTNAARWSREVRELLQQGAPAYRPRPSARDGG